MDYGQTTKDILALLLVVVMLGGVAILRHIIALIRAAKGLRKDPYNS